LGKLSIQIRLIAKSLDRIGVEINEMISISDDKAISLTHFEKLQNTVDLVIVTGGLGPTKDDVTKRRSVTILRTS
jgi:nicotinamide-nucleotide amidase